MAPIVNTAETSFPVQTYRELRHWNEIVEGNFGAVKVGAKAGVPFSATLQHFPAGDVSLYQCSSSPALISHNPDTASGVSKGNYLVKVLLFGTTQLRGAGRKLLLNPGDYVICDNREPYSLDFDSETVIGSIPVSDEQLGSLTLFPKQLSFVKASLDNPVRKVVCEYLQSMFQNLNADTSARTRQGLAKMFLNMVVLSLENESQPTQRPAQIDLFDRCREVIRGSYPDENFSATILAIRVGASLRSVQNAFAAQGCTVSNFIMDFRLTVAHELLSIERYSKKQVSQIAFAVGFKSHAHFSRAYKATYGLTPVESRAISLN